MVVDVKVIISRFIITSIDQYSFQSIILVDDIAYIVRAQGLGQCSRIDRRSDHRTSRIARILLKWEVAK